MTLKPAAPTDAQPANEHTAASVTALLALAGVAADPARAAGAAQTINTQARGARRAFAKVPFETEPATYLKVRSEEAP